MSSLFPKSLHYPDGKVPEQIWPRFLMPKNVIDEITIWLLLSKYSFVSIYHIKIRHVMQLILVFLIKFQFPKSLVLRNIFRNNIDEEIAIVRKTERDHETYKTVCFLALVLTPAAFNTKNIIQYEINWMF